MPLLKIQTNQKKPTESDKVKIHHLGAEILSQELGKSLDFVVVVLETEIEICFGGNSSIPSSYLEIKNVGSLSKEMTQKLSERLCELCFDFLQVSPECCYLEFQESERHLWGWNGKTFA